MASFINSQNYQSFDPRLFPGLFLWNDAQQITGVANGATLTSGNWSNLAADFRFKYVGACSTGATYQTNILNGFPVMRFTTAQEYRFHSSVLALNDCSMYFVSRLTGTTNSRIFQSSNLNLLYGYWGGSKNSFWLENNPGLLNVAPAINANTSWDVYSMNANQKGPYSFRNFGSTIIMGASSYRPAFSGLCINTGRFPNEDSTCELAEVLCYSNCLNLDQSCAVEGYLSWKWGLQGSLPAYHPFKNAPPFLQKSKPFDTSFLPYLWQDAQFTNLQVTSTSNLINWSTLGTAGSGFTSNTNLSTGRVNQAAINGFSTVTFLWGPTRGDEMIWTGSLNSNTRSMFTVHRLRVSLPLDGNVGLFVVRTGAGGMENIIFRTNPAGIYQNRFVRNGTGDIMTATLSQNPNNVVNILTTIYAGNTASGYNRMCENGSNLALTTNTTTTFAAGTNYWYNRGDFTNGGQDLGEFLYYEYDVSPGEQMMTEGYLAWKWQQNTTLPLFHPYRNYIPASPQFSPLNLNSCNTTTAGRGPLQCVFWMDAAQETGANGSFVNSFTEKSGSGLTMTATAANTVTLVRDGLNGKPYYNMGTARFSTGSFVWRTKFTCAVVTNSQFGYFGLSHATAVSGNTYSNYIYQGNWGMLFVFGTTWEDNAILQNNSVVGGSGWNMCIWQYNNSGNPDWRLNGSARATRLTGGTTTADQLTTAPLWINGSANQNFDTSQVAEILIFNDFLNTSQNQKLEGYLAWKWGLVNRLPGNHPFRTQPP